MNETKLKFNTTSQQYESGDADLTLKYETNEQAFVLVDKREATGGGIVRDVKVDGDTVLNVGGVAEINLTATINGIVTKWFFLTASVDNWNSTADHNGVAIKTGDLVVNTSSGDIEIPNSYNSVTMKPLDVWRVYLGTMPGATFVGNLAMKLPPQVRTFTASDQSYSGLKYGVGDLILILADDVTLGFAPYAKKYNKGDFFVNTGSPYPDAASGNLGGGARPLNGVITNILNQYKYMDLESSVMDVIFSYANNPILQAANDLSFIYLTLGFKPNNSSYINLASINFENKTADSRQLFVPYGMFFTSAIGVTGSSTTGSFMVTKNANDLTVSFSFSNGYTPVTSSNVSIITACIIK